MGTLLHTFHHLTIYSLKFLMDTADSDPRLERRKGHAESSGSNGKSSGSIGKATSSRHGLYSHLNPVRLKLESYVKPLLARRSIRLICLGGYPVPSLIVAAAAGY